MKKLAIILLSCSFISASWAATNITKPNAPTIADVSSMQTCIAWSKSMEHYFKKVGNATYREEWFGALADHTVHVNHIAHFQGDGKNMTYIDGEGIGDAPTLGYDTACTVLTHQLSAQGKSSVQEWLNAVYQGAMNNGELPSVAGDRFALYGPSELCKVTNQQGCTVWHGRVQF